MLHGRFGDTTGRPYLEGRVYFPRFRLHGDVSFLVDTGADTSLISATDAIQIGIDFSAISRTSEAQGIGGIVTSFVEPAIIVFIEHGVAIWGYREDLEILPPPDADAHDGSELIDDPDESLKLPSLLGREILDRWRMVYQPSADELSFEVVSADFTIDRRTSSR
ncbi:MAG: aspartyl protease family protein [Dehalococcoidia bacterium]